MHDHDSFDDPDTYDGENFDGEYDDLDDENPEDFGDSMDDDDDTYARKRFADPGGNSALHRESPGNPRIHPCPTCKEPNRLTPRDVSAGYQCDTCADRAEGGGY